MGHRKAIILPIVLCFMLLSHIIYLAIIQLNSIHRQRIVQANHYYQLQIQTLLSQSILQPLLEEQWSSDLEKTLFEEMNNFHTEVLNKHNLITTEFLPAQPLSLLEIQNGSDKPSFLLQNTSIYLRTSSNFEPHLSKIKVKGAWQETNQLINKTKEIVDDSFKQASFDLIAKNYFCYQSLEDDYQSQWLANVADDYLLLFNSGSTSVTTQNSNLHYLSTLKNGELNEKTSSLPNIEYLMRWQANLYQLNE